jgi:2'-5' RNA ligase
MTQSVELLLDEASEARVRDEWDRLDEAGLPGQAQHRGDTNRPHVTMTASRGIAADAEEGLAHLCSEVLPLDAAFGGLAVFGGDPVVLVRLVVVTAELLHLHAAVAGLVALGEDSLLRPGRWTPHVTLARRMPLDRLPAAVRALHPRGVPSAAAGVRFERARRWDGAVRRAWLLG